MYNNYTKYESTEIENVTSATPEEIKVYKNYTKYSEEINLDALLTEYQIWDGGTEIIDVKKYVFYKPQPVADIRRGKYEYPDGGTEEININEYVFIDGTYADNNL